MPALCRWRSIAGPMPWMSLKLSAEDRGVPTGATVECLLAMGCLIRYKLRFAAGAREINSLRLPRLRTSRTARLLIGQDVLSRPARSMLRRLVDLDHRSLDETSDHHRRTRWVKAM